MTRTVWRIAAETPNTSAADLAGTGAKVTGGRWNRPGTALVYCTESIALAALESIIHLNAAGLPLNRYLVRIDIPDSVWSAAVILHAAVAPVGWDAMPTGKASLDAGDAWATSGVSAVLLVPSVIVPEENNVLINPTHAGTKTITASKIRRWQYDARLR